MNRSIIVLLLMVLAACANQPTDPEVVLPTNLNTDIQVTEGLVEVAADAENTNYYVFLFDENGSFTENESQSGEASYTFAAPGTYTIRTRAHVLPDVFIETSDEVVVDFEVPWDGGIPETGYTSPLSYPGYTLVWQDEFDGSDLSSNWVHEIGNGSWGWGNNELQYYLAENTEVSDGLLKITAKEQAIEGFEYTSSRIKTQGLQSFSKGRIDIRAALPYGKGIWPALWMLGESFSSVGWPACGEIDIMELVGGEGYNDRTVHGTIHWSNFGDHAYFGDSYTLADQKFAEEFHVFSIIWDDNSIKWYCDDVLYVEADITPEELSEFQGEFFFIFNVAVGGNWPGSPDASTVFPQTMAVDYVRVFQE